MLNAGLMTEPGPPARCPFTVSFLGESSPAKIDYRKSWYPYSNLSTGGPRNHEGRKQAQFGLRWLSFRANQASEFVPSKQPQVQVFDGMQPRLPWTTQVLKPSALICELFPTRMAPGQLLASRVLSMLVRVCILPVEHEYAEPRSKNPLVRGRLMFLAR